jgi:hypothetical protein
MQDSFARRKKQDQLPAAALLRMWAHINVVVGTRVARDHCKIRLQATGRTVPKRWKMETSRVALAFMIFTGTMGLSSYTWAQQKTIKACQEEWRADKDANQAKGITEKAYVAQCRGGGATAQPAAPSTSPAASPQRASGQKTIKVCQEEWRADKDANQAEGITEKAYVLQCRAGGTAVQSHPSALAAQTPAATPAAPPSAPAASTTTKPVAAPAAPAAPAGQNQFSSEAEAKGHCPSDTVVWVNVTSKIYHYVGYRSYGTTKNGAYMCERDTAVQGMRASKNEKRPGA